MVGLSMFKKRSENDPFAGLLDEAEAGSEARGIGGHPSFLRRVADGGADADAGAGADGAQAADAGAAAGGESEYHSPFRTKEETQRSRDIKMQKFPISSATTYTQDPEKLGYSVVTDRALKKAKDIVIPSRLKDTEAEQKVRLDALVKKEKQLKYWRDSQKIVDAATAGGAAVVAADDQDDDDEVDPEREPAVAEVAEALEEAEAIALDDEEQSVDLSREAKPGAAVRAFEEAEAIALDDEEPEIDPEAEVSPAQAVEALEEAEALAQGQVPPEVPLAAEERQENPSGVVKAPEDDADETVDAKREPRPEGAVRAFEEAEAMALDEDEEQSVDLSREAKPGAAVRAFEEAEAIALDDEEPEIDPEAEVSPEQAVHALEEAEAIATGDAEYLSAPPDINTLPRVPFQTDGAKAAALALGGTGSIAATAAAAAAAAGAAGAGAGAGASAAGSGSGLFGIFKRSKANKQTSNKASTSKSTGIVIAENPPVASPKNPELIVKTEEGYVSKGIYDKLQYDEERHQMKLSEYSQEKNDQYEAKSKEYAEKIKSIQAEIDELDAQMEQFKLDHEENLKLKEVEASQALMQTNVKHVNATADLYKQTEEIKNQTVEDKEAKLVDHQGVQSEIDELLLLKDEVAKEHAEHEAKVNDLTTELDNKTTALTESLAKKDETNAEIERLQEQKQQLEQEIREAEEQHRENTSKIESIDNKEYLPQVNEINTKISTLLGSLALIQQEIANQKVEFSTVSKNLEQERKNQEAQLLKEKEERERLEQERLENQRKEFEKQAEEDRLKHEQELNTLRQTHEEALVQAQQEREAAARKLEEEQRQRELVERERTRLQGEKAIQEQERGNPEDKRLAAEHEQRQKRQAEAAAAVESAQQRNAKTAAAAPAKNLNSTNSSLYDYETVEEIITVD